MLLQRIQINASFWLTLVAYALGGAGIFFTTSMARGTFTNMDDSFPIPIRVVMYVGPFGWLALVLLGALGTLCVHSTLWRLISTIFISVLGIGIMCTVMFTNMERPSRFSRSNERSGVDAGSPFLFGSRWGLHPVSS